jgi:Flp pilus assembly pilin Flp
MKIVTPVRLLWRDDAGQDLLEYALLASLIALVAYAAVASTGGSAASFYDAIATRIKGVLE